MTTVLSEGPAVSPEPDDESFWSSGMAAGEHATWTFSGADGLARLDGPTAFSAPEPHRFRARLTRVQLDHVALEAFAATAHRSERSERHVRAYPTPIVTFALVAEGRVHVETEGRRFDLEPGGCVVVHSSEHVTYVADSDVRMLRSMVGVEHIPRGLRDRGTDRDGPLERTPLVDGYIAFVSSVLRASAAGRPTEGVNLVRAVAELQIEVLAEMDRSMPRDPGEVTLRRRIEDYIDTHLADPELGPRSIAAAFGISLRHVHGTFNEDGRTIGRTIRERRLDAVATEVQTSPAAPRADGLADRFGFTSGEALQRAFRARYGTSLALHRRHGHRTLG